MLRIPSVTFIPVIVLLAASSGSIASGAGADGQVHTGDWWQYEAEVLVSSLTLSGTVTVTYDGLTEIDLEGTTCTVHAYSWNGSMDVSGFKNGAIATGKSAYNAIEYISPLTGYTVATETNLTMDFRTCVGSSDEARHISWNHRYRSYLPIEGDLSAHMGDAEGSTWLREVVIHRITNGTYYQDHIVNNESMVSETMRMTIVSRQTEAVAAGDYACTVLRCIIGEDVETLWLSDDVKGPVKIVRDFDYVDAYYSGELWTLSLEAYSGDSSGLLWQVSLLGSACAIVVVAAVYVSRRRRRLKSTGTPRSTGSSHLSCWPDIQTQEHTMPGSPQEDSSMPSDTDGRR